MYQAFRVRGITPTVVGSGQHHNILTQQQQLLYMPIDAWLMKEQPRLPLDQLYGQIEEACHDLASVSADAAFLNGDTTSALAVAMAGKESVKMLPCPSWLLTEMPPP